uniref:60S ribosomal protein L15 n=1 Tax=Arundo donax TaxID=35708 RepID=A0A0A9HL86_ARUDO
MASPSTRVSPSSTSRGTRGLLLRRGIDVSLVDSGFSTPTG